MKCALDERERERVRERERERERETYALYIICKYSIFF